MHTECPSVYSSSFLFELKQSVALKLGFFLSSLVLDKLQASNRGELREGQWVGTCRVHMIIPINGNTYYQSDLRSSLYFLLLSVSKVNCFCSLVESYRANVCKVTAVICHYFNNFQCLGLATCESYDTGKAVKRAQNLKRDKNL